MHGMFCVEAVFEDRTAETLPKYVRELPRAVQELNSTWSNHNWTLSQRPHTFKGHELPLNTDVLLAKA